MPLDDEGHTVTPILGAKAPDRQPLRNGEGRSSRSKSSEARKPLDLPTSMPVPRAAGGEKGVKRRVAREVDNELSPAEQALQMTQEQLNRHLSRADLKVDAIEAWRNVGRDLLQAARQHFRAHKACGLISQSAFNIKPVNCALAKSLFMSSLTSIPVLKNAAENPSESITITPKYPRVNKPKQLRSDDERAGYYAFVESLKEKQHVASESGAASEEPAGAPEGEQEVSTEQTQGAADATGGKEDEAGEEPVGEATKESVRAARRVSRAEYLRQWEQLDEEAKKEFSRIEEQRAAEYKAALEEEQRMMDSPLSFTLTVRDGDAMRKLLRLPSPQFQAYEYVSFAGQQVQQAVFEKLVLQYNVKEEALKLRAFVGHVPHAAATATAASSASAAAGSA